MKKLLILIIVVATVCANSFARDRPEREKTRRDREKMTKQNERKAYGYGAGKIKIANPADWIKNLEKPIFSGPQPGEKVPSFAATNLRGENAGEELDPVAMAKDKLHLMFFVSKSRTFGRFHRVGRLRRQARRQPV
jgi:hypothetical protein|tara:strand:+ start:276 stop:683 length:408 start_codon:yes stop_codon:yes gene_type:complete